jgi:regulator of protease activity HflC (stomatin/prohibitin superfamily)
MTSGFKKLAEVEAKIAQQKKILLQIPSSKRWLNWDRFMLFQKLIVRKNEYGLLFKDGDFERFLAPGIYRFFDPLRKMQLQRYDLSLPEFEHALSDFFLKNYPETVARLFTVVELNNQQIALVYKNGRLTNLLPPASRMLYWKGVIEVTTEIIDISETFLIPRERSTLLVYTPDSVLRQQVEQFTYHCEIPEYYLGILKVNGQQIETLSPGLYVYWRFNRNIAIELWDTRLQDIEVSGQEILSKDKVSLRINLAASYRIKDVLKMTASLAKPVDYLYRELQFGLRAAVGTRSLDELLENKHIINELVYSYINERAAYLGIEISSVGVKDIILPGEMKLILSKVVEAEKVAQANLIRRREETAATRSLLNTAKVMEDNPTALRLKELETLERLTEKVSNISVYGGLEGLLTELVKSRSVDK